MAHPYVTVKVGLQTWNFPSTVKLPLKDHGEIKILGWDIALGWAIDASDKCFRDNAHGNTLHPCVAQDIIDVLEKDATQERASLARRLGVPLIIAPCHHCKGTGKVEVPAFLPTGH